MYYFVLIKKKKSRSGNSKLFSKRTKKKGRKEKKKGGIGNEQKIREYIFLYGNRKKSIKREENIDLSIRIFNYSESNCVSRFNYFARCT